MAAMRRMRYRRSSRLASSLQWRSSTRMRRDRSLANPLTNAHISWKRRCRSCSGSRLSGEGADPPARSGASLSKLGATVRRRSRASSGLVAGVRAQQVKQRRVGERLVAVEAGALENAIATNRGVGNSFPSEPALANARFTRNEQDAAAAVEQSIQGGELLVAADDNRRADRTNWWHAAGDLQARPTTATLSRTRPESFRI